MQTTELKPVLIAAQVPREMAASLKAVAVEQERSMSAVIRTALTLYLGLDRDPQGAASSVQVHLDAARDAIAAVGKLSVTTADIHRSMESSGNSSTDKR